jgi:hypothetical protein
MIAFEPTPLGEGMAETLAWLRAAPSPIVENTR